MRLCVSRGQTASSRSDRPANRSSVRTVRDKPDRAVRPVPRRVYKSDSCVNRAAKGGKAARAANRGTSLVNRPKPSFNPTKQQAARWEAPVSTALAVCHGSFGRVTVYRLDKPMRTHAHREGHLTFLLSGPPAIITIEDVPHLVDQTAGVAINPWQPHSFQPCSSDQPSVFLVAYICENWLDRRSARVAAVCALAATCCGWERPFGRFARASPTPW